jgi:F0F1-type ATP synthase assembly protein I
MESLAKLTDTDENNHDSDTGRSGLRWMSAGIEFCGVIAVFVFGGYLLDSYFHTSPWLLLTGFFVSFIGMVYLFYKESKK